MHMGPNKFAWESPDEVTIELPDDTDGNEALESEISAVTAQLRAAGVDEAEEERLSAEDLGDDD
jgi:hypothetical protein